MAQIINAQVYTWAQKPSLSTPDHLMESSVSLMQTRSPASTGLSLNTMPGREALGI